MEENRFPSRYDGLLLLTSFIWGSGWVVAKIAYRELTPLTFIALRDVTGFLMLLALAGRYGGREPWRPLARGELGRVAIWGVLGCGLTSVFAFTSLKYTATGNAALLVNTNPLFGFVFATLFLRLRAPWKAWLGVLVSFAGMALLIGNRSQMAGFSLASLRGDMLALGAAVSWAAYTMGVQPYLEGRSLLRMAALTSGSGTAVVLCLAAPDLWRTDWASLTWVSAACVLYMGVCANALGYFIWNLGVARLGGERTIVYNYLIPVVAWSLAVACLGEPIRSPQIAAAAFVFAGLYLARRRA